MKPTHWKSVCYKCRKPFFITKYKLIMGEVICNKSIIPLKSFYSPLGKDFNCSVICKCKGTHFSLHEISDKEWRKLKKMKRDWHVYQWDIFGQTTRMESWEKITDEVAFGIRDQLIGEHYERQNEKSWWTRLWERL